MKKRFLSTIIITVLYFGANAQVASYSFNNGNANDDIGGNNGVVNGATLTTDRFGNLNSAYEFNGVDNYINCGDSSEFRFTSNYGISVWVEIQDVNGQVMGPIVIKRNSNSPYNQYDLGVTGDIQFTGLGNTIQYLHKGDTVPYSRVLISPQLTAGWHHVVTTLDTASMVISMYFDNVLTTQLTYSNPQERYLEVGGSPFEIGGTPAGNFFFKGKIDDVEIYNDYLSPAKIDSLFNASNPVGIDKIVSNEQFTIYPNPTSFKLTIETKEQIEAVNIIDITGKTVKSLTPNIKEIDVAALPKGVYILQLHTISGISHNRFIKE